MYSHQFKGQIQKINGEVYSLIYTHKQIEARYFELGQKIKEDYAHIKKNEPPLLLLGNLMGGAFPLIDLSRILTLIGLDYHLDTVDIKRYPQDEKGGQPIIYKNPSAKLIKRHILVVEDVIDEGLTLNFTRGLIQLWHPLSLQFFALGWKKIISKIDFVPKYVAFELKPEWLIGEGMDTNQSLRGLTGIWQKTNCSLPSNSPA